eukprot:scaffold371334_cov19-Prasinocladus_malaysianus.AAC.1
MVAADLRSSIIQKPNRTRLLQSLLAVISNSGIYMYCYYLRNKPGRQWGKLHACCSHTSYSTKILQGSLSVAIYQRAMSQQLRSHPFFQSPMQRLLESVLLVVCDPEAQGTSSGCSFI